MGEIITILRENLGDCLLLKQNSLREVFQNVFLL